MSGTSTITNIATDVSNALQVESAISPALSALFSLIPGIGAQAAGVAQVVAAMEPFLVNALGIIIQANGGNVLAAGTELVNHLSQGMPNSLVLSSPLPVSPPAASTAGVGGGV